MRLIDADALIERAYRERLDSRELIAQMIESAPTITEDEVVTTWVTRLLDEAKKYMTEEVEHEND